MKGEKDTKDETKDATKEIEKVAEEAAEKVAKEASEKVEEVKEELEKVTEEASKEIEKAGEQVSEEIEEHVGKIEKFEVAKGSPAEGKTVEEIDKQGLLGEDVLLIEVKRGDEKLTPKGDTLVKQGDIVSVKSPEGVGSKTREAFVKG